MPVHSVIMHDADSQTSIFEQLSSCPYVYMDEDGYITTNPKGAKRLGAIVEFGESLDTFNGPRRIELDIRIIVDYGYEQYTVLQRSKCAKEKKELTVENVKKITKFDLLDV